MQKPQSRAYPQCRCSAGIRTAAAVPRHCNGGGRRRIRHDDNDADAGAATASRIAEATSATVAVSAITTAPAAPAR